MRVVLSGGGTGGHIFPALAVAESLSKLQPEIEILYIGGTTGLEKEIVPGTGIPFQTVTTRKLRKVISVSTFGVMWSLLQGYREAITYLRAFKPDAVVGTGGYVAAATVMAAVRLGIPVLIHEGNAVPGRTNRFLARYARQVCVTFETTVGEFPAGKTIATGFPVREGIVLPSDVDPAQARKRFGMSSKKFTILVVGGSQGARALNNVVIDSASALGTAGCQILHITGLKNLKTVQESASAKGLGVETGHYPFAFLDSLSMPAALRAADIIVCRGGISTLSEALVNGLPAIIVPLPSAYADHQTANARALVEAGAAEMLPEAELTASRLVDRLSGFRNDCALRVQRENACNKIGRLNAADDVAKLTLKMKAE